MNAAMAALPSVTDQAATKAIDGWTSVEANRIKAAAASVDAQARLAADSVRAAGTGELTAGGSGRLPSGTGTYGDLFFGAEFGGGSRPETRQFRPYKPTGYWFFPTVEADEDDSLIEAAGDGLDAAAKRWDD